MSAPPLVIRVQSEPPGAEILLDEEARGKTPVASLAIPGNGQHRLTLKKPGYETWTMQVSRTRHPPPVIKLRKETSSWNRGLIKKIFGNK